MATILIGIARSPARGTANPTHLETEADTDAMSAAPSSSHPACRSTPDCVPLLDIIVIIEQPRSSCRSDPDSDGIVSSTGSDNNHLQNHNNGHYKHCRDMSSATAAWEEGAEEGNRRADLGCWCRASCLWRRPAANCS